MPQRGYRTGQGRTQPPPECHSVPPASTLPAYPAGDAVDVALRDGSCIHLRPVADTDRSAIRAFYEELSSDSICFRFFGLPNLDWAAEWSVDVDYGDRYALVATAGQDHAIVSKQQIAFNVGSACPDSSVTRSESRQCSPQAACVR